MHFLLRIPSPFLNPKHKHCGLTTDSSYVYSGKGSHALLNALYHRIEKNYLQLNSNKMLGLSVCYNEVNVIDLENVQSFPI